MILDALLFGIVGLAVTAILWAASDAVRLIESQLGRAKKASS